MGGGRRRRSQTRAGTPRPPGCWRSPLHADRLEGRARLAAGDADGALVPLERARPGFARSAPRWEVALTELALRRGARRARPPRRRGRDTRAGAAAAFARLRVPRELERARALLNTLSPTH